LKVVLLTRVSSSASESSLTHVMTVKSFAPKSKALSLEGRLRLAPAAALRCTACLI